MAETLSSLFESIKENRIKPSKSKGVTVDEHYYYSKKIVSYLKDFNVSGITFLEIRCGNCILAMNSETQLGGEVIGLDKWTEMPTDTEVKEYLVVSKSGVSMVEALEPFPFRDSSFDVIYALLVFYTMKREQRELVLSEVRRTLRSNGYFVLADVYTMRKVRNEVGLKEVFYAQDQGIYVSIFRKP
ncbi:MAG: class I SAM-dependent methyltransferase [Sulfolobales archaeon]|jgi:ubiquinone/menaquinone biosynthesis C-methylase UbiE|nr:class I SAM-dependent methyltransferase [Sulfolobales archaeon]